MIRPGERREEKSLGGQYRMHTNPVAREWLGNEKSGKKYDEPGVHRGRRTVDMMLL